MCIKTWICSDHRNDQADWRWNHTAPPSGKKVLNWRCEKNASSILRLCFTLSIKITRWFSISPLTIHTFLQSSGVFSCLLSADQHNICATMWPKLISLITDHTWKTTADIISSKWSDYCCFLTYCIKITRQGQSTFDHSSSKSPL